MIAHTWRAVVRHGRNKRNMHYYPFLVRQNQWTRFRATPLFIASSVVVVTMYGWYEQEQDVRTDCKQNVTHEDMKHMYTVQKVLGEGAYGKVYLAVRKSDKSKIALKVIMKEEEEDAQKAEIRRETTALETLASPGHKNVCRLYDLHENWKAFFLEIELVQGKELFEHIVRHGSYSEKDSSRFLKQFADGLRYIHSKNLVHGDLKPENLMMDSLSQDLLKIVDFGATVPSKKQKRILACLGTPAYSAPEFLESKNPYPSKATDMYAAGIIMYILLTGSHPFDPWGNASDGEMIKDIIMTKTEQGFLEHFVFDVRTNGLSESAVNLLKSLLNPDPNKRMTSEEFYNHSWIQGKTSATEKIEKSHLKLKEFWQKRFRNAIMERFKVNRTSDGSCVLNEPTLSSIFQSMDLDGNGEVTIDEMKKALSGILGDNLVDVIRSIDEDHNGSIDFEEFKNVMHKTFDKPENISSRKETKKAIASYLMLGASSSKGALQKAFNRIDSNGDGLLQMSEIIDALKGIEGVEEDTVMSWADSADTDLDGNIDFDEFCKAMRMLSSEE